MKINLAGELKMIEVRYVPVVILGLIIGTAFSAKAADGVSWGALAATKTDTEVSVGAGVNFKTKAEAEDGAVEGCRENGVAGCHVVSTFNGCGYIVSGANQGTRSVGWGSGASAAEATAECEKRGLYCTHTPKGGCNN